MASLWQELLYYGRVTKELVFPRRCAVCGRTIDTGYVCEACRPQFLLRRQLHLEPREEYLAGKAAALAEDVLSSILLLYKYDGVYKEALQQLKFASDASLLPLLREEAEAALPGAKLRWLQQFDLITCIPTSEERREQRGYDIPQEIFAPLLEQQSAVVYSDAVLVRRRRTAPLYELGPEERRQELAGCFEVRAAVSLAGKHVLLCDDIFTTGSTLTEAALALLAAGAAKVSALTLAAAQLDWGE